ncbi:MAG: endonuclease/exonuclease/phosphatase family protein [Deltaproteobacteria bacterium]|nr:endonuclease/exonuclease/phosphatase family protein [Deltaproteobacteria bacterium]
MEPPGSSPALRMVSFNMRKGLGDHFSWGGMERLEDALKGESPDLVLLQEVYHPHSETGWGQGERLAAHLGMHLAYSPNNSTPRGHYGNATLSRFPLTVFTNYNISTNRIERRGALYTRVEVNRCPLHLINTHFGLNQRQRKVQVGLLREVIQSHVAPGSPVIVAGDFNDWSGRLRHTIQAQWPLTDALAALSRRQRLTWHSRLPLFPLDHLYFGGLDLQQVQVAAASAWRGLSDHLPVVAQFTAPLGHWQPAPDGTQTWQSSAPPAQSAAHTIPQAG